MNPGRRDRPVRTLVEMFTLRAPRPGDGEGLGRVWEDARRHYSELDPGSYLPPDPTMPVGDYVEGRVLERSADPAALAVVAVGDDDHVVGFVEAVLIEPWNTSPHRMARYNAHRRVGIEALFVRQSHWRGGVGRLLVGAVEEWAERQGAVSVGLTAHARSEVALAFYQALGYDRVGVVFAKTLDDAQ